MEQTTEDTRSLLEVIVYTVIGALTTVLSLVGNSLVCLAFHRNRRLRTVTNFYVLSLAVADIIVAVFVFSFSTVASGLRRWPFNDNFCQFTGFLVYYWAQVSLCILALTSINRYFCVVKPQRYSALFTKKKTVLSILSIRAQDIKASRLLFAAVLGFFVCWTPLSVSFLLGFGWGIFIPPVAQSIFTFLSTFSAWINPIIYGAMNRAMRKEFGKILFCRKEELPA